MANGRPSSLWAFTLKHHIMANDSTLRGGFEAKNDRAHLAVSAAGRPLPIRVTGIRCQPKKADEKKPPEKIRRFLYSGGDEEDRTPDLRIANATLSQLSYVPERPKF